METQKLVKNIYLNVADDFGDAPGGRYRKDGDLSGEEFYDDFLRPKFEQALLSKTTLIVNLDKVWGFPVSFISESFGKLSSKFGKNRVNQYIKLISRDEPLLVKEVSAVIDNPNFRG